MKTIKITKDNVDKLASKFGVAPEDKEDRLPIGYWLVASFGEDDYPIDVVTETALNEKFTLGEEIKNGFFALIRN
jgi:hypothetical protein